jgi:MHS family alpha-ketoglutarate permease-like MFS transporter
MTAGQIAGLGPLIVLQRTMSDDALHSYGWRIPFVVGALGAAVVFYLRRNMLETEVYEEDTSHAGERGTLRALWQHRREAFLVVALTMGGTVATTRTPPTSPSTCPTRRACPSRPPPWSPSPR